MSLALTRDRIAAALADVPDVNGYPTRPTVIQAGDAWPLLDRLDRGPGESWLGSWRVQLILGGDELAALTTLDNVLGDVTDALGTVAYVDGMVPVTFTADAGNMFGSEFTLRSE
jgi:hypothetical protein